MVKMVSLSESAYALLKRHKKPNMSFSDVVERGRWEAEPERTRSKEDLIAWVESLPRPKTRKRTNWSEHLDDLLYGARRA